MSAMSSMLEELPDELLLLIFEFLPSPSITTLQRVSWRMWRVATDSLFWKRRSQSLLPSTHIAHLCFSPLLAQGCGYDQLTTLFLPHPPLLAALAAEAYMLDHGRSVPGYGGVVIHVQVDHASPQPDHIKTPVLSLSLVAEEGTRPWHNPGIHLGTAVVSVQDNGTGAEVDQLANRERKIWSLDLALADGVHLDFHPDYQESRAPVIQVASSHVGQHLTGTYVPLPPRVVIGSGPELDGLYGALYGPHGTELIAVAVMHQHELDRDAQVGTLSYPSWCVPPLPSTPDDEEDEDSVGEGGRLLVGYKVWGDPNVCAAAPSFAFPVRDDGTVEENGWGYIAMRGFRNPEWVPTRFAPPDHHQSSEGTGRIGFRVLWPGYGDMATVYVRVEGMEDLRVLKDVVTEAMYGADGEES